MKTQIWILVSDTDIETGAVAFGSEYAAANFAARTYMEYIDQMDPKTAAKAHAHFDAGEYAELDELWHEWKEEPESGCVDTIYLTMQEIEVPGILDLSELSTILAALRTYQKAGYGDPTRRPDRIHSIAICSDETDGAGECISLDDEGIDALCEKLNCGGFVA